MTETEIQREIGKTLTKMGVFWWRNNSGRMRGRYQVGKKGAPDLIAVINGLFVGIEVKRPDKWLDEDQERFANELMCHGGIYVVCTSAEGARTTVKCIRQWQVFSNQWPMLVNGEFVAEAE